MSEELIEFDVEEIKILFWPDVGEGMFQEVLDVIAELMGEVILKAIDNRVRFETVMSNVEVRFKEGERGANDDMEGNDNKLGFLAPPLKVMLSSNLDGRGVLEGKCHDQILGKPSLPIFAKKFVTSFINQS